tara:strand:- start:696 stop:1049 length:354 start_codon:yes stop_codon:yes gene_type:complete
MDAVQVVVAIKIRDIGTGMGHPSSQANAPSRWATSALVLDALTVHQSVNHAITNRRLFKHATFIEQFGKLGQAILELGIAIALQLKDSQRGSVAQLEPFDAHTLKVGIHRRLAVRPD